MFNTLKHVFEAIYKIMKRKTAYYWYFEKLHSFDDATPMKKNA